MPLPRVLVLRAPGVNCDEETAHAFELAGGRSERIHVGRLLENPKLLTEFQILCLPGGFSFGDDIAAGRILGTQLRVHLRGALAEFHAAGKLIVGICNGFQVLLRSGLLLPADPASGERATLAWNASGKFEDRWVWVRVTSGKSPLLSGIERMYLPVAHAEGRFVARDPATFDALDRAGQIVLRFARGDQSDADDVAYPENPNGAQGNVAGICDATGRIFALMPHPERHVDPTQHPRWTRSQLPAAGDGLRVFQNAVAYFR